MSNYSSFITSQEEINSEEQLQKALSAGYGTDSAMFVGGRAIIPEDIEMTMVNVMEAEKEDCKLMNLLNRVIVKSTVHDYNRRTGVGNYKHLAVEEGGGSKNNDQELERVTREIKYFQDRRSVTDQMQAVYSLEEAYASEKIAGTLNVLKAVEYTCFHGNTEINPLEFDGVLRQIEKSENPNIFDARGKTISSIGDKVITEPVRMIHIRGGRGNKLFMPYLLVQDIQDLVKDRIRFTTTGSGAMSLVITEYPTAYGTVVDFGASAGGDRFFEVKGPVTHDTGPDIPEAPSALVSATATDPKSKFITADAGNYKYSVHSINRYGISVAKELASTVAVSAGGKVTLTITASTGGDETGYVICRSIKDGDELMEMTRIPRVKGSNTTVFEDLNEDLPGTASLVLLTENKIRPMLNWLQLLPLRVRPLYENERAEKPFLIQLFGTLDIKAPEWCAIVKNIQYQGGLIY